GSPEEAAATARNRDTAEADDIDDCDGETFAALVDVAGDEEHEHSRMIDFEAGRLLDAAPELLSALQAASVSMAVRSWLFRGFDESEAGDLCRHSGHHCSLSRRTARVPAAATSPRDHTSAA